MKTLCLSILFFLSLSCAPAWAVVVTRVVDGDTLVLDDGRRVRLIGVDTPETVHPKKPVECFGPQAKEFTKREIAGEDITLTYDRERVDKYNRTLAYVFRKKDGLFLNAELIRGGYARAYIRFPFRLRTHFQLLERRAIRGKRGLWQACPSN
jgi:micrococcal nuclease